MENARKQHKYEIWLSMEITAIGKAIRFNVNVSRALSLMIKVFLFFIVRVTPE